MRNNNKIAIAVFAALALLIALTVTLLIVNASNGGADTPENAVYAQINAINSMNFNEYAYSIHPALRNILLADAGNSTSAYMLAVRNEILSQYESGAEICCSIQYTDHLDGAAQQAILNELDTYVHNISFSDAYTVYYTMIQYADGTYDSPNSIIVAKYNGRWYCLY